jgi:micrococcal nuclease
VVSLVVSACAGSGVDAGRTPASQPRTSALVVEVIDGDTIRVDLQGVETPVRLIGIDTPEIDGPFTDEECFGAEASRFTSAALDGRSVELEYDVERTDRYDRVLAYVWLDGVLFNQRILRRGYAVLSTFPPNVRYVDRLTAAQRAARDDGAGLWGSCLAA